MTVHSKENIEVTFKDGTTIRIILQIIDVASAAPIFLHQSQRIWKTVQKLESLLQLCDIRGNGHQIYDHEDTYMFIKGKRFQVANTALEMCCRWEATMDKEQVIQQLRAQLHVSGHIIGAAVGSGMTAKLAALGGADILLALSAGKFRIMGRSSLSSYFCYGNNNIRTVKAISAVLPSTVSLWNHPSWIR